MWTVAWKEGPKWKLAPFSLRSVTFLEQLPLYEIREKKLCTPSPQKQCCFWTGCRLFFATLPNSSFQCLLPSFTYGACLLCAAVPTRWTSRICFPTQIVDVFGGSSVGGHWGGLKGPDRFSLKCCVLKETVQSVETTHFCSYCVNWVFITGVYFAIVINNCRGSKYTKKWHVWKYPYASWPIEDS